MKRGVTIAMLILVPIIAAAQDIIYEKCDSMAIERILQKHSRNTHKESGKHILAIAEEFIGCKYVPNTLDGHNGEPLYISSTRLDCTTFVELVTAIVLSTKEASPSFATVCHNLERLRYRNGRREGYASRLHYTSWWIADNTCKGIVKEVTTGTSHKFQRLNIDFMSTHPESYAMLSNDTAMQARIAGLTPRRMWNSGSSTISTAAYPLWWIGWIGPAIGKCSSASIPAARKPPTMMC